MAGYGGGQYNNIPGLLLFLYQAMILHTVHTALHIKKYYQTTHNQIKGRVWNISPTFTIIMNQIGKKGKSFRIDPYM